MALFPVLNRLYLILQEFGLETPLQTELTVADLYEMLPDDK
ncbi:MAG: hypothetical protein QXM17_08775 [Metallosphaera sp.]